MRLPASITVTPAGSLSKVTRTSPARSRRRIFPSTLVMSPRRTATPAGFTRVSFLPASTSTVALSEHAASAIAAVIANSVLVVIWFSLRALFVDGEVDVVRRAHAARALGGEHDRLAADEV